MSENNIPRPDTSRRKQDMRRRDERVGLYQAREQAAEFGAHIKGVDNKGVIRARKGDGRSVRRSRHSRRTT